MPTLASELRSKLERVVIEAREAAEAGARAALEALAVHEPKFYPHMSKQSQELRNHLRARARQLGDRQDASGRLAIDHLVQECAYEHWHRMLFARFLAENNLLIEPQENMAISLAEAEELAKEDGVDVWVFASRCAQRMLPQIFRPDDPLLQVSFATEHLLKLEKLLASLPQAVFTASDALGWVYQFWQSKKKDEINRSEVKIGADEISAVTQLFTEPYMVEFLLHNTLGAWWACKKLTAKDAASATGEYELRRKLALPGVGWEYLRFVQGADGEGGPWRPAAGMFDGWPKSTGELKVLDPCCGSGHFLVAALNHLAPIRMADEGLSAAQAIDAVLRDNLHGLEIDERCCQIAAFALAFAAWTYPHAGGYRPLPDLHIASTGIGPQSTQEQWVKLAEQSGMLTRADERERVKNGLLNLYQLFSQAPILGSLINPAEISADVFTADFKTIQPCLAAVLKAESTDDETRERAIAAAGMVKAADLLAGDYTLVITNVPYLARGKHHEILKSYLDSHHSRAKQDLATAFLDRCLELDSKDGAVALVLPQNWLFLTSYAEFRTQLLRYRTWLMLARLGLHAFQTPLRVAPVLLIMRTSAPGETTKLATSLFWSLDVSACSNASDKSEMLNRAAIAGHSQIAQLSNPDSRVLLSEASDLPLLSAFADASHGQGSFDNPRFTLVFWELNGFRDGWVGQQSSASQTSLFDGCHYAFRWQEGRGHLWELMETKKHQGYSSGKWMAGTSLFGRRGVLVNQMGEMPATLYLGNAFNENASVITPRDETNLLPIVCFCFSAEFRDLVKEIDQELKVTCKSLVKIPFNLTHWQNVAAKKYPDGLPEPESDDPTQWLFHGRPEEATAPLQVAVARLLGYRWPAELDDKIRLSNRARALVKRCDELAKFADVDGIVCIPSVRGEEPAAERLLALLGASGVSPAKSRELAAGTDLDDWLRNGFFEDHCKLFHDRPFIWHIWDGRKRDGFHALVNYHRLCEGDNKGRKLLESVTYSYLGEWITRQKDGEQRGEGGAEERLAAAFELKKRLEAILEGEPPFDLFVRWKPLAEQPIGWEPDINDGVCVNIRPFLARDLPAGRTGAGVLRFKPNIKWTKDRGKEPQRPKAEYPWFWGWDETTMDFMGTGKESDGNRHNDCHYSNKAKLAAREAAKGAKRG